jgi:hypothetical protein
MDMAVGGENGTSGSSLEVPPVKVAKKKRSGGPKTPAGKRASSRNSTRHGILSVDPVLPVESIEDREAHLEGMWAAWKPVGHYEDVLVLRAATCLWRRARVDDWVKGLVEAQLDLVTLALSVDEDDDWKQAPGLAWGMSDATFALGVMEILDTAADDTPISPDGADDIVRLLKHLGKFGFRTKWPSLPKGWDPEHCDMWTAGDMRRFLEDVAADQGTTYASIIREAIVNLEVAAMGTEIYADYNQKIRELKTYRALTPSGPDADLEMRYSAHFDREFARILKWFEEAQRARVGGLPAPVRVQIAKE